MGQLVHPVALRGIVAQVDEHLRFVVVEPRGVVDDRLAVEPLVQIGPGLFRKVLFGDTGHRRVAQTPPRKEILRRTQCCRQREQQNRSLHVCSFFGSSGICPVLNIYGSGGKKFSPRCYFLNVPINFFRIIRRNGAQAVDVVRIVGRVDVLVDGKDAHFHACRRIVVDSPTARCPPCRRTRCSKRRC